MPVIDPNKNIATLTQRIDREKNPAFRRMLEEIRYHTAVEAVFDIEKALRRLSPKPEYVLYKSDLPPVTLAGIDVIRRDFYESMYEIVHSDLEWDVITCVVDDRVVVTEGNLKVAMKGTALLKENIDADPEKFYLREGRHLVIWPFDEQLRPIGETVYYGPLTPLVDVAKKPLKREDIGAYTGPIIEPR